MVRVCGSMERPYAKGIFGSYHYNNSSSNNNNNTNNGKSSGGSRHNSQTLRKRRCGGGSSSGWWYFLQEFGSNLNIIMVLTTMCIMMASAGVSNTASTAAATRIGGATGGSDNSESSSSNAANSHHNGYNGRENDGGGRENDGGSGSSNNNNNNNGRNPYHHHHQYRDREHVHPDISDSSSHYSSNNNNNNGGGGSSSGSSSSTNPFAYWTSVTHHYNSYITHPNYHFSSSSSGSPYNYNNGHTYTFGVLLNSENEASTALFLNASTPATPSGKSGDSDSSSNSTATVRPSSKYTLFQQILIAWGATCLGLLTVIGNILVMISFKIDKQLQTISNYFLFSLAVADFLIGTVGMPLTTVYLLAGYWPFGERVCDAWLAVDYLTSNASVLNLLMISFDRYFSVTRPLTYRAKRTTRRAAVMISAAWGISLLLWPPWIYAWPYIEGKRTVPEYKCYIQFIETNHYITFGTAIAAFYIPVSIMLFLYYRIYMETEKRQRDLSQLQAGKKESSRRSNSSDEAMDVEEWKRMRSGSCTCQDHLDQSPSCPAHKRQSPIVHWLSKRWNCLARACEVCIGFCRVDRDPDDPDEAEEEHVSPGTPASIETPLQSSVSRCTSLNVIRDPMAQTPTRRNDSVVSPVQTQSSNPSQPVASAAVTVTASASGAGASGGTTSVTVVGGPASTAAGGGGGTVPTPGAPKEGSNGKLPTSESVYTILIRIPGETEGKNASIRMIQEPGPLPPPPVPGHHQRAKTLSSNPESVYSSGSSASAGGSAGGAGGSGSGGSGSVGGLARRPSSAAPPLHAKLVPKPLTSKGSAGAISATSVVPGQVKRKKKKNQEKKQEKKAAKTLSAILLAFIVTWTPYNILVLLKTIMAEDDAIPETLWDAAYYLCYINSTINPMCYALCNASFRRTYIRILTCKWENTRRQAVQRGYYN